MKKGDGVVGWLIGKVRALASRALFTAGMVETVSDLISFPSETRR